MSRVLIVEDERNIRLWLSVVIRKMGHEVVEAEDGLAAWNILSGDPNFALILTDLRMPNMDGIQLAHRVQKHFPHLPLIIATAHSDPGSGTIRDGPHRFLIKPISHQQLVATVQQVLH